MDVSGVPGADSKSTSISSTDPTCQSSLSASTPSIKSDKMAVPGTTRPDSSSTSISSAHLPPSSLSTSQTSITLDKPDMTLTCQPDLVTTSYLLSNMHCPSCVSHIQDVLYKLRPRPNSISPSLVSSWVTVQHNKSLIMRDIVVALVESGFDVCKALPEGEVDLDTLRVKGGMGYDGATGYLCGLMDRVVNKWNRKSKATTLAKTKRSKIHLQNCEVCRLEAGGKHQKSSLQQSKSLNGTAVDLDSETAFGKAILEEKTSGPLVVVDSSQSEESWRASLAIGGMTCAVCVGTITKEMEKRDWVRNVTVNLISHSATVDFIGEEHKSDIVEIIEDLGYEAVLDEVVNNAKIWRASLAIGGMTCATCSGTITKELEKKDWMKKVVVNLITHSGTVDFIGEGHKNDIVEIIEDLGYEAALDSMVDLKQSEAKSGYHPTSRTIEVSVDGMYSERCPSRIVAALEAFGDRLLIDKPLSLHDPILKITYTPDLPNFTIRHIVGAISAVGASFKPSIYHPPSLEERSQKMHAREQQRLFIRVLVTLTIAVPTLIIGIIYMDLVSSSNPGRQFLDEALCAGVSRSQWALFIMATPVYFFCADVFHKRALKEIRAMWSRGSTTPVLQRFYRFGSMNSLMSLGTSIAYISSVAQLIAAGVHPPSQVDNSSFYFDSVVFLTLFLLIGRLIEAYSKSKTGDAVSMLGMLRPTEALLVQPKSGGTVTGEDTMSGDEIINGKQGEIIERVNVDLLEFGDTVKVLHGGSPPCDGTITQGESKFDESSLTGESKLVKKSIGDEVFSGTVNEDSPVSIKITGIGGSSMLDQIVKAVREGQTRRAPMERIADSITRYFVPLIMLIACSTWIIWLSLGYSGALPQDYLGSESGSWLAWSLQFAIAVCVVACPCGLALAAPTALFVGGGLAAQHGILVKGGGEAFEKASRLDCIVFDKTGTLTVGGEPVVTDHETFPIDSKLEEKTILGLVSAIEGNSSHTVAKAILSFCEDQGTNGINVDKVEEVAGRGMKAESDKGTQVIVGNESLMSENGVTVPESVQIKLDAWKSQGKSVALAAVRMGNDEVGIEKESLPWWHLSAVFSISDPIRPEAPRVIEALRKRGTDVWMLSGDNYLTASAIGAEVGIPASNVIAGVLPSQKAEKIQYLQRSLKARTSGGEYTSKRATIAMVGDGINDSPALTTADIGIAIGSGSDIAISSAEFVLVSSNLNTLITLLDLSRFVFRRIKFNFGWALVYNMTALPVAAGVLFPVVSQGQHIRLNPVWASLAMALSSISVVSSSLALRSRIPGIGFRVKMEVDVNEKEAH